MITGNRFNGLITRIQYESLKTEKSIAAIKERKPR
jgi:hypothetical protein